MRGWVHVRGGYMCEVVHVRGGYMCEVVHVRGWVHV